MYRNTYGVGMETAILHLVMFFLFLLFEFFTLSELPVWNEYVADSRASGQHGQEEHAGPDRSVLSF